MRKKWSSYIYVPVLAFIVAVGGAYIWGKNMGQSQNMPPQVYYLDEYFETETKVEAHEVDEKDVVLEKKAQHTIDHLISEKYEEPVLESLLMPQAEFVLHMVDDYVVVYRCSDMSECYMTTGIGVDELPESTLKEILSGKEILDEEALYFFLESYSS